MAGKQVNFEVNVDASDGIRGLKDFSKAAERAGKDAAKGLEDTAKAGDKARTAIKVMATAFDTELRDAAAAADALGQALGPELTSKMDVNQVVADLNRMGVSFDEIRADADLFAQTLRDVDGIRLQQVNDGLDGTKQRIGSMRGEADQSRSVLANMAGNAAQDLGQLGGVVGTLGVGIGQLAEYAVDGNIKLSNLAKIAGPMAGLAAATLLVTKAMAAMNVKKAFDAAEVERFTEAVRSGESATRTLFETVEETGELEFTNFGLLSADVENVIPTLKQLGITFEDFSGLVEQGPDALREYANQLRVFAQDAEKAGDSTQADRFRDAGDAIDEYAGNVEAAATANEALQGWLKLTPAIADEVLQSFLDQEDVFSRMIPQWDALAQAMRDSRVDTEAEAQLIAALGEEFGLTTEQVIAYGQQRLDEQLEAETAALEAEAVAAEELATQIADVANAVNAAGATLDTVTSRADAFQAALDRINPPSELSQGLQVGQFVEDLRGLGEAIRALPESLFEPGVDLVPDSWAEVLAMPEELAVVQEQLSGFRDIIQSEMTEAFAQGGEPAVKEWAANTRQVITEELRAAGVESQEQINQILSALGLLPDQVTTQVNIAVDEQKLRVLQDIASGAGLTGRRQIAFDIAIANQDPETALQILNAQLEGIGEQVIFFESDTGQVNVALEQITAPHTVPLTPEVVAANQATELLDEIADPRTAEITGEAETVAAANDLLATASEPRSALIVAIANTMGAYAALTSLVNNGTTGGWIADVFARTQNVEWSEAILEHLARDRTADIFTVVHGAGGGTGGGGGGGGATQQAVVGPATMATATPMATTATSISAVTQTPFVPAVQPINVTINAGVLGNHFDVERTVARALRRHQRVNGRR